MLADQVQLPLLRLPAEIRNTAYHYVVCKTQINVHASWLMSHINNSRTVPRGGIALLIICRLIRNEAHDLSMSLLYFVRSVGWDTEVEIDRLVRIESSLEKRYR